MRGTIALLVAASAAGSFSLYFVPTSQRSHVGRRAEYRAREAMLNQETGLRGYLATRDPAYLDPFVRGTAQLTATRDVITTAAHVLFVEGSLRGQRG